MMLVYHFSFQLQKFVAITKINAYGTGNVETDLSVRSSTISPVSERTVFHITKLINVEGKW